MSPAVARARRAFLWVGVVVPFVILVTALMIIASWLPDLPDPAAIHWSGDGPDGFAPRWAQLVTPGVGVVMVVAFALLAWFAHRMPPALLSGGGGVVADGAGTPQWSSTARLLGAVNLGLAAMMALVALQSTGVQRGLSDAADAPDIGIWAVAGFGVLIVLTVVGWFLQPSVPAVRGVLVEPEPTADGGPTEWEGTATMARGGLITLGAAVVVLVVATGFGFAEDVPAGWIVLGTLVVITALAATMTIFRVRVDPDGLVVSGWVGWPRTRITASDISSVRTTTVQPFAEFGGWGWRYSPDGRRGVVLRAGEAIEVTRTDGKAFVVTIDGASDAASVLAAAVRNRS